MVRRCPQCHTIHNAMNTRGYNYTKLLSLFNPRGKKAEIMIMTIITGIFYDISIITIYRVAQKECNEFDR